MRNFLIDGYYKDDKTEFSGYLVSETDDYTDDEIFFYGLSEEDIQAAIKLGDDSGIIDFVITSYEKVLSSEESAIREALIKYDWFLSESNGLDMSDSVDSVDNYLKHYSNN